MISKTSNLEGKLARDHLSICSKYLGKPEKIRDREWGQKAQTKLGHEEQRGLGDKVFVYFF